MSFKKYGRQWMVCFKTKNHLRYDGLRLTSKSEMRYILYTLLFGFWLSSCALLPTPAERANTAEKIAAQRDLTPLDIRTEFFLLRAWRSTGENFVAPTKVVTIYIEGDGFAWSSGSVPSADPTPIDPIGLRLATEQPEGAVAYLARPCQYIIHKDPLCVTKYWTDGRFDSKIVRSFIQAIDLLKVDAKAEKVNLIGYSGGGGLAALISAQRNDVKTLVTISGNLDHARWTTMLGLRPLYGSLNPASEVPRLATSQWHFAGARDQIVPPEVSFSFVSKQRQLGAVAEWVVVKDFDHYCCWVSEWASLWRNVFAQSDLNQVNPLGYAEPSR